MSSVRQSSIVLGACLVISAACTFVPPVQTQSPESSAHTTSTAIPRATRPAATTQAPPPSPTPTQIPSDTPPPPTAAVFPEEQLHTVTNAAGSIVAVIPTAWTDVRSSEWKDERNVVIGPVLVASADVDAFLRWEVEGVSISVSRNPSTGYIQLLDMDYSKYTQICNDPFLRFWDWSSNLHRGRYFVLDDCGGVGDGWLSVLSVVPPGDSRTYVAEVLAYDMIPIFGEDFRDIIMRFEVFPEKLP